MVRGDWGRWLSEFANEREYVASQKGGLVIYWLCQGESLTTQNIADLTGLSWEGARKLACKLSGAVPIVQVDGTWQMAVMRECPN